MIGIRSRTSSILAPVLRSELSPTACGSAGTGWQDWDLVFAQPNGRPLDKHFDYEALCALLRDAGVRQVRLHDDRHAATTLLLTAGAQPRSHGVARPQSDAYDDGYL